MLIATYNGERFLRPLLDSLLAQEFAWFTIVVRDDCSDDATLTIVREYAARHPGRIVLLPSPTCTAGAASNFAALIAAANADFIFLCDQDDIWLPGKMATSFAAMGDLVRTWGHDHPLLVHTDLAVVGPDLQPLSDSLHRYARFDPERHALSDLLLGNVVTGCTIVANRSLYANARPIPAEAGMYDHWLGQVATALGEIRLIPEATVLYRQHGRNVVGVRPAGFVRFVLSVQRTIFSDATFRVLCAYCDQADILRVRYGARLTPRQLAQVSALAEVWTLPRRKRFVKLWKAGLRKPRFAGNIALFLLMLRRRDQPKATQGSSLPGPSSPRRSG